MPWCNRKTLHDCSPSMCCRANLGGSKLLKAERTEVSLGVLRGLRTGAVLSARYCFGVVIGNLVGVLLDVALSRK